MQKYVGVQRLGRMALGLERLACLVASLEVFAVEREAHPFLSREHRIGLGTGRDQDRSRRQLDFPSLRRESDRTGVAVLVDLDARWAEPFGERDTFLQRLLHFLVVERIGRAVDQAPAVGDRYASPGLEQPEAVLGTGCAQRSRVR